MLHFAEVRAGGEDTHTEGASLHLPYPRSSGRLTVSGAQLLPSRLRCRVIPWACRPFTPSFMATVGPEAVPVWGQSHHMKVREETVATTERVGYVEGHLLSALCSWVHLKRQQDRGCSPVLPRGPLQTVE